MKLTATLISILLCFHLSSQAQRAAIPYFDDFETGAPGWTPYVDVQAGTNWELGTPATGFTVGAFSGTQCWDINLNDVYSNYAVCYLSSPVFDFTYVSLAHISFWTKYRTEYLWDYMSVQYTVDNGDTWSYLPFPNLINTDGYVEKWIKSSLQVPDLFGYPEVQFRFVFVSDNSITFDGYSIDDFRIDSEPLSNPELSQDEVFSFYPNPSRGEVNFSFSDAVNEAAEVTIYDATGKHVFQQKTDALSINSNLKLQLPAGIYSVAFDDKITRSVKKLVIFQ